MQRFVNLEVQSSWQVYTAFCEPRSADFVGGTALVVNLEVQISQQMQHLVNLEVQISRQAQHLVNLSTVTL